MHFIEAFDSLITSPDIHLYYSQPSSGDFYTDYIHCYIHHDTTQDYGLYIGIYGDTDSNFHFFNSVVAEYKKPEKFKKGIRIAITKVEKILKTDFIPENYHFILSRNNIHKSNYTKTRKKKIDLKKHKNEINSILKKHNMTITIGRYGKNSVQIYINDECIDKDPDLLKNFSSSKEIAQYIIKKYKQD